MPVFDFRCSACDRVFEFSRPFGSDEKPACPACGSKKTEKMIAPPAVHFKGSGWYKTDSRAKPATPAKKEEKTKEKPAEAAEKPAPKKDEPKPKIEGKT